MSRSDLAKLRSRMALVAYFRSQFGVKDPDDRASIDAYYDELDECEEGYDAEGRSYVYRLVRAKADSDDLSTEQLLSYDENVREHTETLNKRRTDPIRLKPFQVLAALMTEAYLDRVTNERQSILRDLNEFVAERNEDKGRIKFPEFDDSDLDKLAFWMATGSGKTLLMHLNYYQYLDYAEDADDFPENVLLVTPNEGLSDQHLDELKESSIPCRHFNAETFDLRSVGENPVKVIEIHKLTEEKEGEGLSVEVGAFEGRNLVFVDEGHKGAGIDQTWRKLRESLAEEGFTFEYSATFGQALSSSSVEVEEEYGKAILFDYSYPRFYADGYGKDYHIVNLENVIDPDLRDRYLLANLLAFYEQIYVFEEQPKTYQNTYNIEFPLLVFIGHTVNATTKSEVNKNEDRTLADIEQILVFVGRVLQNEGDWVVPAINRILADDVGLVEEGAASPFGDSFETLRDAELSAQDIYDRLLRDVFHVTASSGLELVDVKKADGEIGIRATGTDEFFGVINIGGDKVFLDRVGDAHDYVAVEEDEFQQSLFQSIDSRDSSINLLLGSRKFVEGWDSFRVSSMGLMNFGRGEGSQVIQLFGRGVRLLGKGRTLKRSAELEGDHPADLPVLERLNVFGVRADYMAKFRDYLSEEGIDTEPREIVQISTRTQDHFEGQGLVVLRPETETSFDEVVHFELEATGDLTPEIDLRPTIEVEASRGGEFEGSAGGVPRRIRSELLSILDWRAIYRELWHYRATNGYRNLVAEPETLREILEEGYYTLHCPEEMLEVETFADRERIQQITVMILRKYVDEFYNRRQKRWEQRQLSYAPLEGEVDREQGNFIEHYELEVKQRNAEDFLEELNEIVDTDRLYTSEAGIPHRIHFDRHLYLPLLAEEANLDEEDVRYSPPALNTGEVELIRELMDHFESTSGAKILNSWDVYLLRNQSRGKGVGLFSDGHRFFPDFILWFQNDDHQHVVFLEPHGYVMAGEPLEDHRATMYEGIKEIQEDLEGTTDARTISLHSYVVSQTSLNELRYRSHADTRREFNDVGIYFPDQVEEIVTDVFD